MPPMPGAVEDAGAAGAALAGGQLRRLARRLEFDRAVFYALAARAWQTLAGPVTVLLIVAYFSPEMQGYYYTFGSVIGFQVLFELNLSVVLLTAAGHEWALLRIDEDGRVTGDPHALDRLASLERFGRKWYAAVAIVCWLAVGGTGLWLFRDLPASGIGAWIATATGAAATLYLMPRQAILLGCHQVEEVNRVGATQTVSGSVAMWASVPSGAGLWSVAASWWVKLAWEAWLVRRRYGVFFRSLRERVTPPIRWAAEVWPLQWRLAVQAVVTSVAFGSFTVALFTLRGDEGKIAAGRLGMTWTVLNMLLWAGQAWVQTRIPTLAGLARRGDRAAYDRLFVKVTALTVAAVSTGSVAAWLGVVAMNVAGLGIAERFTDPATFGLMAAAVAAQHGINCLTIYARTRQRESFFAVNVIYNALMIAGVWLSVPAFGERGVAAVYAGTSILLGVPAWSAVWRRERRAWRRADTESVEAGELTVVPSGENAGRAKD